MAIEGITGAVGTYQAPVQTKTARKVEAPVATETSSAQVVSDISMDTRIVNGANASQGDSNQNQNGRQPSEETMKQAISDINKQLSNTECVFGVHEATNRVTIRIVDKSSKEVIKELPPEKTLDMIAKVWELAGLLVDEKL
ncbi:MAG: flagellar protein FlaG [Lachnospiraceae bacterium]|nr:flagellar protein FlaG [Lachnospiraceae bacterium]